MSEVPRERPRTPGSPRPPYSPGGLRTTEPINLADLLERVLDKGIVIAGDIKIFIGDIELLTIKIRLLIASVDKAQEIGINWWESDPALSSQNRELRTQRDELSRRLDRVEAMAGLDSDSDFPWEGEPALSAQNRELRRQRDELLKRLDEVEARLPDLEHKEEQTDGTEKKGGRKRS